jgi:hypothetical protein
MSNMCQAFVFNNGVVFSLNYMHIKLTFDHVIHATDGCETGFLMKQIMSNNINGFSNASISNERRYDINYMHKQFGRFDQEVLINTVKMYRFKSLLKCCLSSEQIQKPTTIKAEALEKGSTQKL